MESSVPAYLLLSGVEFISLTLSYDFDLVKRIAKIVLVFVMHEVFQLLKVIAWSPVLHLSQQKLFVRYARLSKVENPSFIHPLLEFPTMLKVSAERGVRAMELEAKL